MGLRLGKMLPPGTFNDSSRSLTWSNLYIPANSCWSSGLYIDKRAGRWTNDYIHATASFVMSGNQETCIVSARW